MILEVGTAVAKSILQLWTKDLPVVSDATSSIFDIIKSLTSDRITQNKARRQIEAIGEKVGENIFQLFEADSVTLDEGSKISIALAVASIFNNKNISSISILKNNLDPIRLSTYLLNNETSVFQHFSEVESALYRRIIKESCTCIVDIASQLPFFTERTFSEVLKREDQIISVTTEVLQEVRHIRAQLDPQKEAEQFEHEYRMAVARKLDVLELVGTNLSYKNKRHRLSVAYVMLSVKEKVGEDLAEHEKSLHDKDREILPVDQVLGNQSLDASRILVIKGLAGSGKTTLLQWIAVNTATRKFSGKLSSWNNLIPFYIRLRQFNRSDFPFVESFPGLISQAIADAKPKGWVTSLRASKRAIFLIDGLDEVPTSQYESMRAWLTDLIDTYYQSYFIITSRPHYSTEDLLIYKGLTEVEMQPMVLNDIYSFIDHWHEAVKEETNEENEKEAIKDLAKYLKKTVKLNKSIRSLATNPLLCAMLCALNREKNQQLPKDRIELYEACCNLLIDQRDKARHIELDNYPQLNYRQKRLLLEDFAYWLIQNNWSEVELPQAIERFSKKLEVMQNVPQDISGLDICRLFIERAGIIREPVIDRIDFTHRTFQEFLAAQAVIDNDDIDVLVCNAHNDQWREMIILAAGIAKSECDYLILELINRGDEERQYKYHIHLLAVACLETSIVLDQDIKQELQERLSDLVPPRNMTEATALATAGELVVPLLGPDNQRNEHYTSMCIQTLALIGSESALRKLELYAVDATPSILDKLIRVGDFFEKDVYARFVLSKALKGHYSTRFTNIDGFQYFTKLISLNLSACWNLTDPRPLSSLKQLDSLTLDGCWSLKDISFITELINLTSLDLKGCRVLNDISPLAYLTKLTYLNLEGGHLISDISSLTQIIQLIDLNLEECQMVNDLGPLAQMTQLKSLNLEGCRLINDLRPLAQMTQLLNLDLKGCLNTENLEPLVSLNSLQKLSLSRCSRVADFSILANLKDLQFLDISFCKGLKKLDFIDQLDQLAALDISECKCLNDISPLKNLKKLRWLDISGCEILNDLSPLSQLTQLTTIVLNKSIGFDDLSILTNLGYLELITSHELFKQLRIPKNVKVHLITED